MFIITGNNVQTKQVKILDTEDNKEDWTDYEILKRGIKQGLKVSGFNNGIICQSLDVYQEILQQARQILSKVTILNLSAQQRDDMLVSLLTKYGLISKNIDWLYFATLDRLFLENVNKYLDIRNNQIIPVTKGIEVARDLVIKNDAKIKELLKELDFLTFEGLNPNILYKLNYNKDLETYFILIDSKIYTIKFEKTFRISFTSFMSKYKDTAYKNLVIYNVYLQDAYYRCTEKDYIITRINLINNVNSQIDEQVYQDVIEQHIKRMQKLRQYFNGGRF